LFLVVVYFFISPARFNLAWDWWSWLGDAQKNLRRSVSCRSTIAMPTSLERLLHVWPGALNASLAALLASYAVARLYATEFVAARKLMLSRNAFIVAAGFGATGAYVAARYFWRKHLFFNRGRGKFRAYPPLRGSDDAAGFTATSIRSRLPRIIDDIIVTMPDIPAAAVEQLLLLRLEISSNSVITGLPELSASSATAETGPDREPTWPS
jgi:hypothetical protein